MPYGLPYKGSKSRLAERILQILPPAHTLVDIFAGGCAITHAAILSGRYERIIANDISPYPALFRAAASGCLSLTMHWVSREEYKAVQASDPLTALIYSFGSAAKGYAYSADIEPVKRAIHEAITAQALDARIIAFSRAVHAIFSYCRRQSGGSVTLSRYRYRCDKEVEYIALTHDRMIPIDQLARDASIERIARIQALASLKRLLDRFPLTISQLDYRDLPITNGAIIYADPPYDSTDKYASGTFDSAAFLDWVKNNPAPVFFSEYAELPEFSAVASWPLQRTYGTSKSTKAIEILYANRPAADLLAAQSLPL